MFDDTNDLDMDQDTYDVARITIAAKKKCCGGQRAACKGCGKCDLMKKMAREYGELPWSG